MSASAVETQSHVSQNSSHEPGGDAADLERLRNECNDLRGLGDDLRHWKHPLPKALEKNLRQVEIHLRDGNVDAARGLLRSIEGDIRALYAPVREKRNYKASLARLKNQYGGIAKFAASVGKHSPAIKGLLAEYQKAADAARYHAKASPDELQAALEGLDSAGRQLVESLVKEVDENAAGSASGAERQRNLYDLLDSAYGGTIERGTHVKPENLRQWILSRWLATAAPGQDAKIPLTKKGHADELLGLSDAAQPARPPAPHEAEYFRELHAAHALLHGMNRYGALATDLFSAIKLTPEQFCIWRDLDTTLKGLPAGDLRPDVNNVDRVVGEEERQLREDPGRYTQAMKHLERAKELADQLASTCSADLSRRIDELEKIRDPRQRAQETVQLVTDHTRYDQELAVVRKLPAEQQIKLLHALRGGVSAAQLSLEVQEAQSKIYKSMSLDDAFLQLEKRVRKDVIEDLTRGHARHQLRRAQAEWPTLSEKEKLKILNLVAESYCKTAGFKPPRIVFGALSATIGGVFRPQDGRIIINSKSAEVGDFAASMETIFHENSHNWQYQMMDSMQSSSPIPVRDERHGQVQRFAANRGFYDANPDESKGKPHGAGPPANTQAAYKEQPIEAHAFLAGRKFARGLMRALNQQEVSS